MPRMTPEEFQRFQEQRRLAAHKTTGRPVLDALLAGAAGVADMSLDADKDPEAVAEGEEIALHREIMKELNRRGWVYIYHDPTRRATCQPGVPDFIIAAPGGKTLYVECKTKVGKLSKEQGIFRDRVVALGHWFYVVRSVQWFRRMINSDYWTGKGV